jgi:hypothetical protein
VFLGDPAVGDHPVEVVAAVDTFVVEAGRGKEEPADSGGAGVEEFLAAKSVVGQRAGNR